MEEYHIRAQHLQQLICSLLGTGILLSLLMMYWWILLVLANLRDFPVTGLRGLFSLSSSRYFSVRERMHLSLRNFFRLGLETGFAGSLRVMEVLEHISRWWLSSAEQLLKEFMGEIQFQTIEIESLKFITLITQDRNYYRILSYIILLLYRMQNNPKIKSLNTLVCQIDPVFKQKTENILRIQTQLSKYTHGHKLDLVMFPEMAFIGYNFKDYQDILPHTEKCGEGDSFQFCRNLAQRLNAYVIYGYAEKEGTSTQGEKYSLYNSACLIDRKGEIVINTRKTHMYYSDELWSLEGEGFKAVTLYNVNNEPIKCSIGICMDINAKGFKSGKYQLADFILQSQSEVLLFLSAWNDHEPLAKNEEESQIGIIDYWMGRLLPVIKMPLEKKKPLLVIVCDRTGEEITYTDSKEGRTNFIGTSCLFRLNPPQLVQKLGKKKEDFLHVNTWIKNT